MNKEAIINIVASIVIGFIGLWIMINPGIGLDFVRFYLSIILGVVGLVFIALYFISKKKSFMKIIEGIALIAIGLFLMFSFHFSLAMVNIGVLIWLVIEGILGIGHFFKYLKHKARFAFVVFIYIIVAFGIAAYIGYRLLQGAQVTIVQLAGIFMFVKGIVGLLDAINYPRLYMKEKKSV